MIVRLLVSLAAALMLAAAGIPRQAQPAPASPRDRLERAYRASNRGVALLEQFDYPAAAEAFRDALRVEPTLAIARLNLAIALLYAGQAEAALPEARAAAAAMPDAPQPSYVLGLIARADNRAEDAEAPFRRVLQIDPSDAGANVNLGQLLLQRRDFAGAIAAFRRAAAAEAYNATAAYGLATALTRSGETAAGQQAMAHFQILRDHPYAVTYAQGYLQQGRYGEAIASTGAEPGLVDRASPAITFPEVPDVLPASRRERAPDATGGVLLFDADGDGDLDLVIAGAAGARLLRNAGGRYTASTAVPAAPSGTAEVRAAAGDYDNDGRPDLLLSGARSLRLLHQRADGTFEDATARAALPHDRGAGAVSWVDVDHDGDLDVVTAAPLRLVRNNGNGTFADITRDAGLGTAGGDAAAPPGVRPQPTGSGTIVRGQVEDRQYMAAAVVPTDYDNRRDVDLLIVSGGRPPRLFRNLRDGTFRDVAAEAGLPQTEGIVAAAAADLNKDGFVDFFFARSRARGVFALSDGKQRFVLRDAPEMTAGASVAQFIDYDNDGLFDLLIGGTQGTRLLRGPGDAWSDETAGAGLAGARAAVGSLATGDVDRDGDTDIVMWRERTGVVVRRNDGGSRRRAIAVTLAARVSNRSALGAKIEIRAGSLRQMIEAAAASPAVGPADLLFGLGDRDHADVIRVLWPSGILQSELAPSASARIAELDRKPSSCPYLYTWNGSRFAFVTDFLGGGEMGSWIGPRQFNTPDPEEFVRIPGDRLQPRHGRYELRVTNELEEALFLDRVRLLVVDHPGAVDVFPDEGLRDPPRPSFRLYATREPRPPVRAHDEHGHDVRDLVVALDRRWPADFAMTPVRGYAAPHALTLDLGADADRAVVLLTGWTGYAFSADNVAASQAGVALRPPSLEVRDASGRWETIDTNVGFPVGRPQTIVVDMAGRWRGPSREVRISTSMPIYWDQIRVATPDRMPSYSIAAIEPSIAELRWRGFSASASPDGREPFGADYERVSAAAPWKSFPGAYTREGDVRTVLAAADDQFVISKPGDEIALSFDASAAPPLKAGWRRTFLLQADGFSKEMNIRSATPDSLGPLPFHGMSRYPYGAGERDPRSEAQRQHVERDRTRVVPRAIPSLDLAALRASAPGGR